MEEKPNCHQELHENCQKFQYNIRVSPHTIQSLNRNGLHGNWPQKTSLNKSCLIAARFNFAKTFLDKENCFWEQVVWIDKTKIEPFWHNDVQKIRHMKGEVFFPKNVGDSMMFSGLDQGGLDY